MNPRPGMEEKERPKPQSKHYGSATSAYLAAYGPAQQAWEHLWLWMLTHFDATPMLTHVSYGMLFIMSTTIVWAGPSL